MTRLVVGALLFLGCVPEGDADWPQWRGPGGLGVSIASDLPVEWSDAETNTRWTVALQGQGNSSPIVAFNTVYLTEARRENPGETPKRFSRWLLAVDGEKGAVKWEKRIVTTDAEPKHRQNTFSSPTPVADRHGVYVISVLISLVYSTQEMLTGWLRWTRTTLPLSATARRVLPYSLRMSLSSCKTASGATGSDLLT